MKVLCVFGRNAYGDASRGVSTEYRSFVPALTRLGYEVVLFDSWDRAAYADLADLNRKLYETVERERPDFMLFVPMMAEVWIETLTAIKNRGDVTCICWTTDDSWKYEQQSRYIAPAFHTITTTYPEAFSKYHRDGIRHVMLTQWAASADDLREPVPAAQCRYRVSFVGAAHGNRKARVEALARRGIEVTCFGHGWAGGSLSGEEMLDVIRHSEITLNFANSQGANQLKARVFEVPGAGGFLLTEYAPGLEDYYSIGSEIDSFATDEELEEKIRRYLDHPEQRDAMCVRAFERTRDEHTYDARLREVFAFAANARREWARTAQSDTAPSLAAACERHKIGAMHKLLRRVLVAATTLIWGAQRGRRAARRIVFEMSWRLAGAKTYMAAGLPGRLFPRD